MTTQLLEAYNMHGLKTLVMAIVSIAGAFMTLYAVYIGYLFATASDEGKRRAAKARLFKVLGSAFIIYALVAVLAVINVDFIGLKQEAPTTGSGSGSGNSNTTAQTGLECPNPTAWMLDPTNGGMVSREGIVFRNLNLTIYASDFTYNGGTPEGGIKIVNANPELPMNTSYSKFETKSNGNGVFVYYYSDTGATTMEIACYNKNGQPAIKCKVYVAIDGVGTQSIDIYIPVATNYPNNIKFNIR